MAWLAVDKDGKCHIFDRKVKRYFGTKEERNQPMSIAEEEQSNIWITDLDNYKNFPKFGIHTNKIEINYYSMVHLTGSEMSWEDEPVEI